MQEHCYRGRIGTWCWHGKGAGPSPKQRQRWWCCEKHDPSSWGNEAARTVSKHCSSRMPTAQRADASRHCVQALTLCPCPPTPTSLSCLSLPISNPPPKPSTWIPEWQRWPPPSSHLDMGWGEPSEYKKLERPWWRPFLTCFTPISKYSTRVFPVFAVDEV